LPWWCGGGGGACVLDAFLNKKNMPTNLELGYKMAKIMRGAQYSKIIN
jgi:hypothetical protein